MTAAGGTTDALLVERVREGDREAFAEVYERYADRLFDFAVGMLRNREDAADAVADSFVTMAERLSQLRDPSRLRPWLYAVVRRECLRRLKARTRVAHGDDEQLAELPDSAASPEEQAETAAVRELVWAAAEGLNERDRALLDLHLRHGLEGQELADAMGITAGNAYTSINRLKTQLERALGALLVARRGSADCRELGTILEGWDGTFSVLVRKRVARHVDRCVVCDDRRAAMSPLSLVAGLPLLVAPGSLRERVLGDVRLVSARSDTTPGSETAAGEGVVDAGPPVGAGALGSRDRHRRLAQVLPAVAVLVIGALLVLGAMDRGPTALAELDADAGDAPASAPSPTAGGLTVLPSPDPLEPIPTTPTAAPPISAPPPAAPSVTAPPTSAPPAAPGVVVVSPALLDLGDVARAGSVTLTNTGGVAVDYGLTAADSWAVPPAGGTLAPGESVTVTVFVDRASLPVGTSESVVTVAWATGAVSFTVRATEAADPSSGPTLRVP